MHINLLVGEQHSLLLQASPGGEPNLDRPWNPFDVGWTRSSALGLVAVALLFAVSPFRIDRRRSAAGFRAAHMLRDGRQSR